VGFVAGAAGIVEISWTANPEVDLAGYLLYVTEPANPAAILQSIEIGKDLASFTVNYAEYPNLAVGTAYDFYLAAKDTQGNLSEKTKAIERTAVDLTAEAAGTTPVVTSGGTSSGAERPLWYWYLAALLVVLGGGGFAAYWFKFRPHRVLTAKPGQKSAPEKTEQSEQSEQPESAGQAG
jgi:hypothetical protein